MDNDEHLAKLKPLKIERGNGALFSTPDECMQWIDNVLPLLKYDKQHYIDFYNHSQYVRRTSLSADTLMAHLNPMIGIVSQAIIELENNIKSPIEVVSVHNPAANPAASAPNKKMNPFAMSHIKIFEAVMGALVFACIVYLIAQNYDLRLQP